MAATMQELETALVNAHSAGDRPAAEALAAEIGRQRAMPTTAPTSPAPATPPTLDQKFRGSAAGGVVQAWRDPIDAGAQMLVRAATDPIRKIVDDFGNWLADMGFPVSRSSGVEGVDRMVSENERRYQGARRVVSGQEDPGFDWARLGGTILNPVNLTAARLLPIKPGMTMAAKAGTGAAAGTVGGALTPVTEMAPDQSFAATKAAQTGLGAVGGAVLTPALSKVADSLAGRLARFAGSSSAAGAKAAANADAMLAQALSETGQTVADVPPQVIQSLRSQVADALRHGRKLDAAALLRQADADVVGVKLTQGQLTRDPTQFAAERNLRGVTEGLPLMQRFDEQNRTMTSLLTKGFGADRAAEPYAAGGQLIDSLRAADQGMRAQVTNAYTAARGSAGAGSELNLTGLAQDYAKIISDYGTKNIPQAVAQRLEQMGLLSGTQRKLVTAADAEDLLQVINKNRSNDPAVNSALGEIREAVKRAVTTAEVDGGPFTTARAMAAQRFALHDAVPALKAAANGEVSADDFVQRFVLRAKTDEAKRLAAMLSRNDPEAFQQARDQIGASLARAAFGENTAGDRVFASERFAKALRTMGSEKLRAFFTPEEVAKVQALARVSSYINATPAGSPVNTSNTAAAMFNLMRSIPGMPSVFAIGSHVAAPVRNSRVVSTALSEQVPHTAADLPPEFLRLLGPLTTAGGIAGGSLAASPLK